MLDSSESCVAPQLQPCPDPKGIAEPVGILAFERGRETLLVEQQELERGGEVTVIAEVDDMDTHAARPGRKVQVIEGALRVADMLQHRLRAGDVEDLRADRREVLHAHLVVGDAEGIEPVHGLATAQRGWVKAREIIPSMLADHIDKRGMPILGPAPVCTSRCRRSPLRAPCQDQGEPHVPARTCFEDALSFEIARGEVEPGQKLRHLAPAIGVALGEIKLVRESCCIAAAIGAGVTVVAGAEIKRAVPMAEITVAVLLNKPDGGVGAADLLAIFKQEEP